ncbi:MAG: signal peptidase I [Candidatus Bathyarchaeota archaeon]|nr:signal peptidase I [Candidatus Bathyarchaeota archaeon]
MPELRSLLKNEYVKSLIFLGIVLGGIAAFWVGLRLGLRTDHPLLAVASPSMVPTLQVGDMIVVQGGFAGCEINVGRYLSASPGDVIVFHTHLPGGPNLRPWTSGDELIVHRAVEKNQVGEKWEFKTWGDNNGQMDSWDVPEAYVVGKVVGVVPYVGGIPLYIRTPTGIAIIVGLIAILIVVEIVIPLIREKETTETQKEDLPSEPPSS